MKYIGREGLKLGRLRKKTTHNIQKIEKVSCQKVGLRLSLAWRALRFNLDVDSDRLLFSKLNAFSGRRWHKHLAIFAKQLNQSVVGYITKFWMFEIKIK